MNRPQAKPIETVRVDDERDWLPAHVRGDREAFGRLVSAYRGFVMTLLWRYGVDPASRDDLFQEIFLKIHRAAARYRPEHALRPWLTTIALNEARNHRRKSGRRSHSLTSLFHLSNQDHGNSQIAGADEVAECDATRSFLESQISALPERQREVLVLSTMRGLCLKDIARTLAIPENTVKTHLRRARLSLAKALCRRDAVEN